MSLACYVARNSQVTPDSRSVADDIDPSSLAVEHHDAVGEGKQRVVLALSHVRAGMELRAQLADQDVARLAPAVRQTA